MCVASGDGDSSHTTAQRRGGGAAASGRWRDGGTSSGAKFILRELLLFSPIFEKWLMQTQPGECVEMADVLPDRFES